MARQEKSATLHVFDIYFITEITPAISRHLFMNIISYKIKSVSTEYVKLDYTLKCIVFNFEEKQYPQPQPQGLKILLKSEN